MSKRGTPALLHDLAHHAGRIRDVVAASGSSGAFLKDKVAQEAVLWNFVVLGEACTRLGEPFQESNPQIPWLGIIDQRNLIAHGYDIVNWTRLIETIERDIPKLIRETEILLAKYGPPPRTPSE